MASYSLDEFFAELDAERQKRATMPLWRRIIYDTPRAIQIVIPRVLKSIPFHVRVRFNRAVHGWDEFDWWEYASQNSERAVILLTILRQKAHGYKCMNETETWEEHECKSDVCGVLWNAILDDIIFFHTVVANESRLDLTAEESDRYLRGRTAYADYYEALWD